MIFARIVLTTHLKTDDKYATADNLSHLFDKLAHGEILSLVEESKAKAVKIERIPEAEYVKFTGQTTGRRRV